jgi:hypothetical protein
MLQSLLVAYVQFMITALNVEITSNANNLKHGVFVCITRPPQCYRNELYQKLWLRVSYIFTASEINILYRNVRILHTNAYIQYIYTLEVCTYNSDIVIRYVV